LVNKLIFYLNQKFKNMGKKLFQFLSALMMLLLVIPMVSNAQGKASFAGSWALNESKSNFGDFGGGGGGGMRMGGGNFDVAQETNLLTVTRTMNTPDGETRTTVTKYTLDGKECVNSSPRGDSKSVATWSADGKTLTIVTSRTFDMNGESMTMKSSEAWSITDAKTLSVVRTMNTPDGQEMKTTMVYDKK
jgi:Tol biopolymer transport system component